MHRQRNIYQSRTLDLLRNCLSDGQNGGCKQRGQTAIWLKALLTPRLAVCSRDLHWHWINWTLLCDTMEVSMLRLAWLPIAQHVFQPALTGRLELISRKIVSSEQEQRLSRWADFAKNCLPRIECKELPRFREKYCALGHHVCKIREIGGQKKWGPTCDRDISNSAIYTTAIYRAYTVLCSSDISRSFFYPQESYYTHQNHIRHTTHGRDTGFYFLRLSLTWVLHASLSSCMQYRVVLGCHIKGWTWLANSC